MTRENLIAAGLEQLSIALAQIRSDTVGRIECLEHTVTELEIICRKQSDLLNELMRKSVLAEMQRNGRQCNSQRRDEGAQIKVALPEEDFIQLRNRLADNAAGSLLAEVKQSITAGAPRRIEGCVFAPLDAMITLSSPGIELVESESGIELPLVSGPDDPRVDASGGLSQPDGSPAQPESTSGYLVTSIQHDQDSSIDQGNFRAGGENDATDPGVIFASGKSSMALAANDSSRRLYFFWVLGAVLGVVVLATALVLGKQEKDPVVVGAFFPNIRALSSHSEFRVISEKALRDMAKNGNPKANTILGLRVLDGSGATPVSLLEAAAYLKRAAEGGNPVAQFRLASLYEHGDGVATDLASAKHWYEIAANQGNRNAMHNLAVLYSSGAVGGKDLQQAAHWFAKAASLGVTDSQFNLALLYEYGYGVTRNMLEAGKWYSIAARSGDKESQRRAKQLQTQLGPAERALVSQAAREFHVLSLDPAANVPPDLNNL